MTIDTIDTYATVAEVQNIIQDQYDLRTRVNAIDNIFCSTEETILGLENRINATETIYSITNSTCHDLQTQIDQIKDTLSILIDKYNALVPPISFEEMIEGE